MLKINYNMRQIFVLLNRQQSLITKYTCMKKNTLKYDM